MAKTKLNFENVNDKLELFRRIYNLGLNDIEAAMVKSHCQEHMIDKYKACRDSEGFYGNFKFFFQLDLYHAQLMMDYVGF